MNNYYFLSIVVIFNYFILNVLANDYYIVTIRRDSKDIEYDKASEKVQTEIDNLVNDRMNDIYDIIADNQETYKADEKLEELKVVSQLKKRSEGVDKKMKFSFINKNRPSKHQNSLKLNSLNDDEIEYIPFESKLVLHICPVSNYYVIIAYLTEDIVSKIKSLPNVINCGKAHVSEKHQNKYYNENNILNETQWSGLSVQESKFDFSFGRSHLSLLSQGKYDGISSSLYDDNYYYPASAGKGIDIIIVDGGLDQSISQEDFDTYEGTPDERIIKCHGTVVGGQFKTVTDMKDCKVGGQFDVDHGTFVSISAAGTVNGVAKKANIHMIAADDFSFDVLVSLDYIKRTARPHKSVVNISTGFVIAEQENCDVKVIQDKINELVDMGIIIFVSAGNSSDDACQGDRIYANCDGVITVGALNNRKISLRNNMENMYEIASYSCFGECVAIFAPGTVRVVDPVTNKVKYEKSGTSFASPFSAGLASTIMSENPEIKYDFESMKKKLIDLSLKGVIKGLNNKTPNRLINNGKHSIYDPPRCDDPSKKYKCQNSCCSRLGYCADPNNNSLNSLCRVENGCKVGYGLCYKKKIVKKSSLNQN